MRRRRVVVPVVLAVVAAGLVVVRPWDSGSGSGAPSEPSSGPGGVSGSFVDGRGGDVRGGTLRVGVTRLGNLDPAQARSVEQLLVADQLFDSLTAYDPTTLEPVPSVAARWEVSPDQREWTFFLRSGARFANGRPIVASDVKYSFERAARRGSGSPAADLVRVVSGYAEFRAGADDATGEGDATGPGPGLAGVTAPADDTVRITLDEPMAEWASVVASPVLAVVPEEAVEAAPPAAPFAEAPVGSGPFRFGRREGTVVSLVRAAGGGAGVGRVDVVQFETQGQAYRAFTRGRLDWARVPPEEVEEAGRRYGDSAFRPYVAQLFYGFNVKHPKLADVRFREAIVRAIDRRAVVAAVYQGTVRAADGVVAEGVAAYQAGACRRCAHDPPRARALLAEAFGGGAAVPEVNLDFDDDPTQAAIAEAVKASLSEVGIRVALRPRPAGAYDQFALSGDKEVFRLGWVPAFPSPEAFLTPLFHSGSGSNLMGLEAPAVDTLLAAARAEPDKGRRQAKYQEAERAILELVPVIPIAQFEFQSVVSRRVRGLRVTSLGTFDAVAVSLAGRG